ncbi:MAG TPA: 1-deoxy-D-xylulose-5-phosphate synthase [Verrucomicrobiales bacterium]|nr:1-deoxy-D-xylulose-5-phosphate synthase [Verrucomicrobiales bacterium]
MRDVLIQEFYARARKDPRLLFISADLGAESLDTFRADLPRQFIHPGICEQNMIDVAAGLASAGKTVFTYAMASFITARCYEQLKVALGAMNKPVTVVSVGVGLGYDDAGPTHYTTEDIACLRALPNIEVWTPCDEESTREITIECCERPAFRYLRLERPGLPNVYQGNFRSAMGAGFCEVAPGGDVLILSSGYMLHRALAVREQLRMEGLEVTVTDLFRIKPLASRDLAAYASRFSHVITLEEQCLAGGFGSAVAEALVDQGVAKPMLRLGLPDRYFFENGGRGHVLEKSGLGVSTLAQRITEFTAPAARSRNRLPSVPQSVSF